MKWGRVHCREGQRAGLLGGLISRECKKGWRGGAENSAVKREGGLDVKGRELCCAVGTEDTDVRTGLG